MDDIYGFAQPVRAPSPPATSIAVPPRIAASVSAPVSPSTHLTLSSEDEFINSLLSSDGAETPVTSIFTESAIDYATEAVKPQISYAALIEEAILNSPEKAMRLANIYEYIRSHYAYFRQPNNGWQVRCAAERSALRVGPATGA